jgi:hypothetical protein
MNGSKEHLLKRAALVTTVVAVVLASAGAAEAGGIYNRIEQDWELVLNTPDLNFPSPQIVIPMKGRPEGTKTAYFLINHHDFPEFQKGGGQIQLWEGDVQQVKSFAGPTLIRDGEVVTWTQYLERKDGKFHFGLSAVAGEAWGTNTAADLGGPVSFVDGNPWFTDYDSAYSVDNVVIMFGDGRVHSLKLLEVRKYKISGGVDTEPARTVYP